MTTLSQYTTYKKLVAASQNEVWSESVAGTLTQVTGATVDTTDMLSMFEAYSKVCVVNGTILGIVDFANTRIDLGVGNELTTPPLKGDTLTQATSGAQMVVDFVDSTKRYIYGRTITTTAFNTTNTFSSDNASGQTMSPTTATPAVVTEAYDAPLWYSWTKHPSKTNSLPTKAYLGCLYRGRAVLSGNPDNPHQWYMSRQEDIFDFDYSSTDAQSAVAGNDANMGKIGDIVRALIPFGDDYLVFGCASSMWVLRGDPVAGGELDERSHTTGIYGANSWCKDHVGNLYFWGSNGLYVMKNTGTNLGLPINLSEVNLPKLVEDEDADPTTHRITLGFDRKRNGIVISITKVSDGTNSGYWFDIQTEGFFPESYNAANGVYSQFYYDANDPAYSNLLLGGSDGYIRVFSDSSKDDNIGASTSAINSYMTILTQIANDDDRHGVINSMTFFTSGGESGGDESDTDAITYSIYVGDDAETAMEREKDGETAFLSGTLSGTGRQNRVRNRIRTSWLMLKVGNSTASQSWSMEKIVIVANSKGRIK